ncbi:hypothetical protein CIB84_016817, partial [Bambusicola thoracicus]
NSGSPISEAQSNISSAKFVSKPEDTRRVSLSFWKVEKINKPWDKLWKLQQTHFCGTLRITTTLPIVKQPENAGTCSSPGGRLHWESQVGASFAFYITTCLSILNSTGQQ